MRQRSMVIECECRLNIELSQGLLLGLPRTEPLVATIHLSLV
jgi:hypothetical protein